MAVSILRFLPNRKDKALQTGSCSESHFGLSERMQCTQPLLSAALGTVHNGTKATLCTIIHPNYPCDSTTHVICMAINSHLRPAKKRNFKATTSQLATKKWPEAVRVRIKL